MHDPDRRAAVAARNRPKPAATGPGAGAEGLPTVGTFMPKIAPDMEGVKRLYRADVRLAAKKIRKDFLAARKR